MWEVEKRESGNWVELRGNRCVYKDGFSLHANVEIAGKDQKGKERLIRYILRPSISSDRLKKGEDGDYEYYLKRKWSDGTESIKFSGEELIVRLISLIPPPRMNLIRYFGVLGPNSSLRKKVVKRAKQKPKEKSGRRYIEWAKLLKRVFKIDITKCSCGGEVKIISSITDTAIIMPILEHLNLAFGLVLSIDQKHLKNLYFENKSENELVGNFKYIGIYQAD